MVSDTISTVASSAELVPHGQRTYEQFLEEYDEDTRAEWVDGEVITHMPPESLHQIIVALVRVIVGWYGRRHRLGAVNHDLFIKVGKVAKVPDVAFILGITQDELPKTVLPRADDLAVEVVSEESANRDRVVKRQEYEASGVREYWLADVLAMKPRFYQQFDIDELVEVSPDRDGIYESRVLTGLRFPASWLVRPVTEEYALEWLRLAVPYERYESERHRAARALRLARLERRLKHAERLLALEERQRADRERQRAERERRRAERERQRAEGERQRADHERALAEGERDRGDRLERLLRDHGIDPNAQ